MGFVTVSHYTTHTETLKLLFSSPQHGLAVFLFMYLFLLLALCKDCKDIEGDRADGVKNLFTLAPRFAPFLIFFLSSVYVFIFYSVLDISIFYTILFALLLFSFITYALWTKRVFVLFYRLCTSALHNYPGHNNLL